MMRWRTGTRPKNSPTSFGRAALMSMPISRMASMASGFTRAAGSVPALRTSNSSAAFSRSRPSAIWLRAEFPVQSTRTVGRAMHPSRSLWLGGANERAHELTLNLPRRRLSIDPLRREKLPRLADVVDARRLHTDGREARALQLVDVIG